MQHTNHQAEGLWDIFCGIVLAFVSTVWQYGAPFFIGMLGAAGSITMRIIYKRYIKKYFENDKK